MFYHQLPVSWRSYLLTGVLGILFCVHLSQPYHCIFSVFPLFLLLQSNKVQVCGYTHISLTISMTNDILIGKDAAVKTIKSILICARELEFSKIY